MPTGSFNRMYTLKLVLIVLGSILQSIPIIALGLVDPRGKRVYPLFRFWSWCVLKTGGVRLRIRRTGHLDPSRAYIFMANHQSNIDIPVLVQALAPLQLRWMAKRELLRVPFFGWALWASKHIIVKRARSKDVAAAMASACEKLAQGISVVVFPEGTRRHGRTTAAVQTRRISPGREGGGSHRARYPQRIGRADEAGRLASQARGSGNHSRRSDFPGRCR